MYRTDDPLARKHLPLHVDRAPRPCGVVRAAPAPARPASCSRCVRSVLQCRFRVSSVAHPRCLADVRVSPHRFISELAKAEALEKVEAKAEAEKKKD